MPIAHCGRVLINILNYNAVYNSYNVNEFICCNVRHAYTHIFTYTHPLTRSCTHTRARTHTRTHIVYCYATLQFVI